MARYKSSKIFNNSLDYYEYLRENRNIKIIDHYATPILKNPTIAERTRIISNSHIWSFGDRFYKLADQYYGNSEYWWVIAWYNSTPTEVDLSYGNIIEIPINLTSVLQALGLEY